MTRKNSNPEPASKSRFDAREFFVSFAYGMGAFMGVAALFGLLLFAYLYLIFDLLAGR